MTFRQQESELQILVPMLVHMRSNLKKVGLDTGDESIWTVVFKVFCFIPITSETAY